jgi:HAE1 family hydrophobic/amphiphilic exporter-1
MSQIELPAGYKVQWGGDVKMMEEAMTDMLRTFIIAILLTYMLLAAMLESLTQPLMIMGTIPLALMGVFVAMDITGSTMNIISMLAIVMLVGIVVNNAVLIFDYTNILRKEGRGVKEALIEACPTKLKPIIMATVAIILGMIPMALGMGASGREIRQPMGIVSIGGLVASTLLILVAMPSIYYLTTRQKKSQKIEE